MLSANDIETGKCSGCGGSFLVSELTVNKEVDRAFCEACQYEYEAKMDAMSDE